MELVGAAAIVAGLILLSRVSTNRLRNRISSRSRGLRPGRTISGRAFVTDGDGLRVRGHTIRIAGVDAPEHDQAAKHRDGYWFPHGKRVKGELIREIGGKHVLVSVEGVDKYGRLLGSVTCQGRDIGEWLVRQGHAIAAYSDRYGHVEREARRAGAACGVTPTTSTRGTTGAGSRGRDETGAPAHILHFDRSAAGAARRNPASILAAEPASKTKPDSSGTSPAMTQGAGEIFLLRLPPVGSGRNEDER